MAMLEVPRTDRRLVNVPDVRMFRDNPGERWGVAADTAGKALGGLADGLDALSRAARLKLRIQEQDRENEASLMASRYRAHSRNGWNGYMDRDANGNEVRVKGARDKTFEDYGPGQTTLSDIEAIDASFREREDFKKMDAATREAFERKILPCRDEMMQLAQQKAYADRVAKGKADFDEKVREWGEEVETTFGGDDAAYDSASDQNAIREAIATFGYGEVANAAELDGMPRVSVEDVRFANDPTGARADRLRKLVAAKRKVYDLRYFDALCASAAGGRTLGKLSPEACAAKAAAFAAEVGETEAERAALAAKAEKAGLHLEAVKEEARKAAVRENRQESMRRQSEFWKGSPAASAMPGFFDGEAEMAERAGDYSSAVEFRQRAARMRDAIEKSAREARESALEDRMRREELELYRDGRRPTEEERREFEVRWQKILEERDAKAALSHAKRASEATGEIESRTRRERQEELARNYDRLRWMLIREQDLRANKGREEEANLLMMDINYEFAALKKEYGLSAADAESFARELARAAGGDDAAISRLFDEAFDMTLDEDGDGAVTASELRAFGKSGDKFEPKWAKGDKMDARTRLRLRGEFLSRISSLPPGVDRREAAKEVLKEFEARYVKGRFDDAIAYMSGLFTDVDAAIRARYREVRLARDEAAEKAELARRTRAGGLYTTPEALEVREEQERLEEQVNEIGPYDGGGASPLNYGAEPVND